jgi:hypothetical protein
MSGTRQRLREAQLAGPLGWGVLGATNERSRAMPITLGRVAVPPAWINCGLRKNEAPPLTDRRRP